MLFCVVSSMFCVHKHRCHVKSVPNERQHNNEIKQFSHLMWGFFFVASLRMLLRASWTFIFEKNIFWTLILLCFTLCLQSRSVQEIIITLWRNESKGTHVHLLPSCLINFIFFGMRLFHSLMMFLLMFLSVCVCMWTRIMLWLVKTRKNCRNIYFLNRQWRVWWRNTFEALALRNPLHN